MKLRLFKILFLLALSLQSVLSDDEFVIDEDKITEEQIKRLNEELESPEVIEKLEFFGDFACYLRVQKYLQLNEEKLSENNNLDNNRIAIVKLILNIFNECRLDMTEDQKIQIITAQSKDEIMDIQFANYDQFDIDEYLSDPNPELNEDELLWLDMYTDIEKKALDLKQKQLDEEEKDGYWGMEPYIKILMSDTVSLYIPLGLVIIFLLYSYLGSKKEVEAPVTPPKEKEEDKKTK